jgi:hypothetical protein
MATPEELHKKSSSKMLPVKDTVEEQGKNETPKKLKKTSPPDILSEKLVSRGISKFLDASELEELCTFKDQDFTDISIESRVIRLREVREWFFKEEGANAAEKSGFIYSVSVESRLLSFLIARSFDVAGTKVMIQNHVSWLSNYKIYEINVAVACPTA